MPYIPRSLAGMSLKWVFALSFPVFSRTSQPMPVALITGANRGLGVELTRQYVDGGWQLFATCRDPPSANQLQGMSAKAHDKFATVAMDVTDAPTVCAAVADVGDVRIDLL